MPRKRRNWIDGACYHITHRCHERQFLLKFVKDRVLYVSYLQKMKKRFPNVKVLNYAVTSNHIHLLISCDVGSESISPAIQYAHGQFAQKYNFLRKRSGEFWSDRFHATMIQSGRHLHRCMLYIDFNMVRCGVVEHPLDWKHSGIHQLLKPAKRYRIIDNATVLDRLDKRTMENFKEWYVEAVNERIEQGDYFESEHYFSSATAVGDSAWLYSHFRQLKQLGLTVKTFVSNGLEISFLGKKS